MKENLKAGLFVKDDEAKYDDGNWYAVTLGTFIGLLVDAGQDPAVMFRVVTDSPVDVNGKFTRKIEMILLPDGYVKAGVSESHRAHKTLLALLEGGVIG